LHASAGGHNAVCTAVLVISHECSCAHALVILQEQVELASALSRACTYHLPTAMADFGPCESTSRRSSGLGDLAACATRTIDNPPL
jgi:hypothetical protein